MKKLMTAISLAAVLAIPAASHANLFNVRLHQLVYLENDEECAADVEVRGIDGGLINGSEALLFNGIDVGNFSELTLKSGYKIGDRFLFASPSFALKLGLTLGADYDVEITDQDCADFFQDHGTIGFRTSFGNRLDFFTVESLRLNASWSFNGDTGLHEEVDLATNSIMLTGLMGSWILGTGPLFGGAIGGPGGCTLAQASAPAETGIVVPLLLALGLIAVRRLRNRA